ncbi:Predicted integral membrane protein [Mycobacteroides abscessus subsp. abscessus]|uniref:Predicted integral membrane protein n=1 Tax=Mycobacteroides abscessus subsp. abscessus TaxID=1185650 RepID=A0AB38D011_9MYCO|nr:Predicted integral membrane protein [Mycobacteroides abscessus subsp. abscessus]SHP07175.1 Predicted integral membrane protein [Mycobacteroides abscessus subsp. abscessus]SHP38316.1 Predicted integral membrane protein [Mycobacteroides abscessus subsp. abscessus]SHP46315.1 Predicted integral membrane protein [Mycobacteroides abscessus subsp. abscessus]SHP46766.1 Predicted integral membrane protein [Mycobacteroides abscessus subsp. abscessus]
MPKWLGVLLCPMLALFASIAFWMLLSNMWYACDIGSNFARGASLILALPVVFLFTLAATAVLFGFVSRIRRTWAGFVAVGASAVVAVLTVVVSVAVVYSPENYVPSAQCPSGVPSWWPFPA